MWVEYFAVVKIMNPKEEIMIYLLIKTVSIISKVSRCILLKKIVCLENMNAIITIFSTFILECTVVYWLS